MSMSFGESLKMARERTGYTQIEVSRLTNLSQSQLSRYKNDETSPTADIIKSLALLYNVSSDFLFGLQKSSGHDGIIEIETDVQIGLNCFLSLSPENRVRSIGYMEALATIELENTSDKNSSVVQTTKKVVLR